MTTTSKATLAQQQLTEIRNQELKRKQNHSLVEKKRRQRMDNQIQQLKKLVPALVIRDEQEKLQILKSTTVYIQKLQDLLRDLSKNDPTIESQVHAFLPQKNHTILTLLPNYRPNVPFSNPPSPPSSSASEENSDEVKKVMSVTNLLC
jgi:hypothetical protein